MSKQSKTARKLAKARGSKMQKGPSKTTKLHTKVRTWYNSNSPTFWKKPKETKKPQKSDQEKAGLSVFRLLEEQKAKNVRKLRADMGA